MFELQRAKYEARYGVRFVADRLGDGKDGLVLLHRRLNGVKFLRDPQDYKRELRAYRVLRDANVDQICGYQVPKLVQSDNEVLAIEMTVVAPPFLLDFVSTYTDEELAWLAFDADVWAEREAHWAEVFGDRWPHVAALRDAFFRITGFHSLTSRRTTSGLSNRHIPRSQAGAASLKHCVFFLLSVSTRCSALIRARPH